MKIAIVFDDLIQFGGAERLLLAVHEVWPDAPIYTSVASKRWQQICAEKEIKLHTSFMQKLPWVEKLNRFYAVFFLHVLAFESFDLHKQNDTSDSDYDVVLSISTRFAHGVNTKPTTKHVCYMNSPGRMFWEPFDYFEGEFNRHKITKKLSTLFLLPFLSILRLWDYSAAQRIDYFIANSKTPQKRIKSYYWRNSTIIHPFVDLTTKQGSDKKPDDYFVILTRLVSWKRVDIAVRACSLNNIKLKIIGDGPDIGRLKKIAGPSIEFLGYIHDEAEKIRLLKNSLALIVTQHEDFGIAPLEAMSVGTPIIAYKKGGVLETVIASKTGEFFDAQDENSLAQALLAFDPLMYRPQDCINRADQFSKETFKKRLRDCINSVYLKN
jgi:glycosyltransferase involved in cell wall biosynthesis